MGHACCRDVKLKKSAGAGVSYGMKFFGEKAIAILQLLKGATRSDFFRPFCDMQVARINL